MTLSTGIGGGIVGGGRVSRGADSYAGEIGHLTIRPGRTRVPLRPHGCFERMCCGLWLERDHGRPAKELLQDPAFVRRYVVDLALGLKACDHAAESRADRDRRRHQQGRRRLFVPLREELRRQITSWSRARIDVRAGGARRR